MLQWIKLPLQNHYVRFFFFFFIVSVHTCSLQRKKADIIWTINFPSENQPYPLTVAEKKLCNLEYCLSVDV